MVGKFLKHWMQHFSSTGKLVLGRHEEKGKHHASQDLLVFFYINFSDFLCTLYKTPYMVTIRDSFYVLSDNHRIKSHLNLENCLLFTQRDQINMCVCMK